jgi:hypothetical protein
MTLLLRSQHLDREPKLTAGTELTCQHDGAEVQLIVSSPQPALHDGRWVNGTVGGRPAVVWLSW